VSYQGVLRYFTYAAKELLLCNFYLPCEAMNSSFHVITKLEAAERQLAQAIRMFFDRSDAISIHTLAAAAYQILIDICAKRGIVREVEDSTILSELGVKKEVINAMRDPQNFFKHAHSGNADDSIRFNQMLSVCLMFSACRYSHQISGRQLQESIVLQLWFYARFPERAPDPIRLVLNSHVGLIDPEDFSFFAEQFK
jgi:hypothetical protein